MSVQRPFLGFDSSAHGDFHFYKNEGCHVDPGAKFKLTSCQGGSCSPSRTPCGYVNLKNPRRGTIILVESLYSAYSLVLVK
jgi:hypothetical protein